MKNWRDGQIVIRPNNLDCHFDDGSTLVLGFRPKSVDQADKDGDNPNVAINYTHADGSAFFDYRLYDTSQVSARKDRCDLRFGPSTLTGDWKTWLWDGPLWRSPTSFISTARPGVPPSAAT